MACDLVLVDAGLAGGTEGVPLADRIRHGSNPPQVVMVSGRGDAESIAQACDAGASGYVVKPFEPSQLLAAVLVGLARGRQERSDREERRRTATALHTLAADLVKRQDSEAAQSRAQLMAQLSSREQHIVQLLAEHYPFSRLKGPANVLIFPDLQSANAAYKLVARLAGAEAIGPLLLGMRKPVQVLQHGTEVKDIVKKFKPWLARGGLHMLEDVPSEELRALYRHAKVTVCPSFGEGFDYSGVEAMRCGSVVAASDIPVHREVFGDAAEYFSAYSVHDVAGAIARLLGPHSADRRRELAMAGEVKASSYMPERVLPQWQAFLESLRTRTVEKREPELVGLS